MSITTVITMATDHDNDQILQNYQYESTHHSGTILKGLNYLRNQHLLFDITLIVGGNRFEAHKVVLASCSEYFRAMFTDELKESKMQEIVLNGVTSTGIRYLLDYAYTSKLPLNLENIQDVLSAASHTQIVSIVNACSDYLLSQIDLENCVDVWNIAELFSLKKLETRTKRFICENLHKIACLPEYQLLTAKQILTLLTSNFPIDCAEVAVLDCALDWIVFNKEDRLQHADAILETINFKSINKDALASLQNLHTFFDILNMFPHVNAIVWKSFLKTHPTDQNDQNCISGLVNHRGFKEALVTVGGFQSSSGITNRLTYFHPEKEIWMHLTDIPHVEQCNYGVAVLKNQIYVAGGCFNQSLQENIHPFCFSYNPGKDAWNPIAPMIQERCRFCLAALNDKLYAIGGMGEGDEMEVVENSPCEVYDPSNNTWTEIQPMPGRRVQHAGAVYRDMLFVTGGLDYQDVLNTMKCYNTTTDTWSDCANMPSPRADHSAVQHGGKIYVIGGWFEDQNGRRVIVDTIDCYDIDSDSWQTVTQVPTPRYHADAVVLKDKLYLIGGFTQRRFDRATHKIEIFDLVNSRWQTNERYPTELWEHAACSVYVPLCREDKAI